MVARRALLADDLAKMCGNSVVWPTLFLLGCYHGLNPGMGWLFAVALGYQDRSALAVVRAIVPLTMGHVISVAIVVLVATFAAVQLPHKAVHFAAAAILIGFGIYRLVRARHIRWVGMRVGFWGLTLWGFLMSSAHGAGLMLLPMVMPMSGGNGARGGVHHRLADGRRAHPRLRAHRDGGRAAGLHEVRREFLRTAWVNVDAVWAGALNPDRPHCFLHLKAHKKET